MKRTTKKMSVILSAALCLGGIGLPAVTQASDVQPAAQMSLNTLQVSDSHDQLTLKGNMQFDGNYIKINLSREGGLFSEKVAGINLNDKGEPYFADGSIASVDVKTTLPEGMDLKSPRWYLGSDANKAVVVVPVGWLTEQQKASLTASSELSVTVKIKGIEEPYVLKLPLKQAGVVRNLQPPALKKDSQLEVKTTRIAVGESSVRIALTAKGEPVNANTLGFDLYDNLGNELKYVARESVRPAKNTALEDLVFEAPRPDAKYLILRPNQAVFEQGSTGAFKLDDQGNTVKIYNKQLEIKIPLK